MPFDFFGPMPTYAIVVEPANDQAFRRATTFLGSTVCVVTGRTRANVSFGLTVSSVLSTSIDPPLLVASIDHRATCLPRLLEAAMIAVHLLRGGQAEIAKVFANSATAAHALARLDSDPGAPPRLLDALARFDCRVDSSVPAGDHVLLLLRVERVETGVGTPLVYWRRGLYDIDRPEAFLDSPDALEAFVRAWKTGTLPRARWSRAAHVAVAAYHAFHLGSEAYPEMRSGILHFKDCCGIENTDTSGYHETLTRVCGRR